MQRTDFAEIFIERFSSVPLTWENVYRGTEYQDKTRKEVVDLLLVLRSEGIFISLKCQRNPTKRRGDKLSKWINKKTKEALVQLKGGIRTSQTKAFWCEHPRRGKTYFKPNEIKITQAIVLVETLNIVSLHDDFPLIIGNIPVYYFSVNDFLNIINELRTIRDIQKYLEARLSLPQDVAVTLGLEKVVYEYYILNNGVFPPVHDMSHIVNEVNCNRESIDRLLSVKHDMDKNTYYVEGISNALSERLRNHEKGLDERYVTRYDNSSNRINYILMQNELCDLVLVERRMLGQQIYELINAIKNNSDLMSMCYQALSLTSKPHFQYVFAAAKGIERGDLIERSEKLIKAALSYHNKEKGMIISYNNDIDNFEIIMVDKFVKNDADLENGILLFSQLKVAAIPIERI